MLLCLRLADHPFGLSFGFVMATRFLFCFPGQGDRSLVSEKERLLSDVPYAVRWSLAYHLDTDEDLFYSLVKNCDKSLQFIDLIHLLKRRSPTIALFDHLNARFPNFTVSHLRQLLTEIKAYKLEEILETYLKSECSRNAETLRRRKSTHNPFARRLKKHEAESMDSGLSDTCSSPLYLSEDV